MPALYPQPASLIAVVEDAPTLLELLDEALRDAGYHTVLSTRGTDAHRIIRERRPDLVILDMRLEHPHVGEIVLGLLELDPATREILVIICSAGRYARARAAHFEARGHRLLEKPFAIADLLALITALLGPAPSQPSQDVRGE